jgi:hypothetical protein
MWHFCHSRPLVAASTLGDVTASAYRKELATVIGSLTTLHHRAAERVRRVFADVRELDERRALLDRPWEEDFLHWARDDQGWQLHGKFVPPARRRTNSVTSQGWCPHMSRTAGSVRIR